MRQTKGLKVHPLQCLFWPVIHDEVRPSTSGGGGGENMVTTRIRHKRQENVIKFGLGMFFSQWESLALYSVYCVSQIRPARVTRERFIQSHGCCSLI